MKPKLIILNGPLGIGKSTLAKRYADAHPLTLNLDIDEVWSMISHWREKNEISAPLSKKIALEMAKVHLLARHDVVLPQILQTIELAESFQKLAFESGADYYEVLLNVPKEEAIRRFIERGKRQGHPTGFREGGTIATGGREDKLNEMYDNMIAVANLRPHIIRIMPSLGEIDAAYEELLGKINHEIRT